MSRSPLVLLHHAGGSASVFDPLVAALPDWIEPVALELPGRGRRWREPLLTAADDAIDDLADTLDSMQVNEFAAFGHSLGAYLCLGLVARLEEKRGIRCTKLFASANAGPVGMTLPFAGSPLRTTDEEIFAVAEHFGGGIDPKVRANNHLSGRAADLLRADFALSHSFLDKKQTTVTEADIIVCCGRDDVFSAEQLRRWSMNSTGATEILHFDGGHFYLLEQAEGVAEAIACRMPVQVR